MTKPKVTCLCGDELDYEAVKKMNYESVFKQGQEQEKKRILRIVADAMFKPAHWISEGQAKDLIKQIQGEKK